MIAKTRLPISLLLILSAAQHCRATDAPLTRFTFAEGHMGTQFKITAYAKGESEANRAAKAAFARVAELDRIMSDYRSASELMRLCQKAGGPPVTVSEDL